MLAGYDRNAGAQKKLDIQEIVGKLPAAVRNVRLCSDRGRARMFRKT